MWCNNHQHESGCPASAASERMFACGATTVNTDQVVLQLQHQKVCLDVVLQRPLIIHGNSAWRTSLQRRRYTDCDGT
jgi:hypothetical protein